jgi:acyl carrier protein
MYAKIVLDAARALDLLDSGGQLAPLDSLMVVDFITEIEGSTSLRFRADDVHWKNFASLESIVALLEAISQREEPRG